MSYTLYALTNKNLDRIYVGFSKNIDRRISEHNSGSVRSTKPYRPWIMFYSEEVPNRIIAREREKYWKSGCGKEFLKRFRDRKFRGSSVAEQLAVTQVQSQLPMETLE